MPYTVITPENTLLAQRAELPLAGQVQGIVTIVQEDRFRLQDEAGRGYLFTLGRKSGVSLNDLQLWNRGQVPITVQYQGPPDLGAVAVRVAVERASGIRHWA